MDVGDLLREARARVGMSAQDLADAAQTGRSAIYAYEAGRRSPTVRTLTRLLGACELQVRATLEPRHAQVDARVDAMLADHGKVPGLSAEIWPSIVASLEDREPEQTSWNRPRRGAVAWAVDGSSALVLNGFAVPTEHVDLVVELDEALRFWMKSAMLQGTNARGFVVLGWFDASLELMQESLGVARPSRFGFLRVRVVEKLPPTVNVQLEWLPDPVRVVTVDEVEQAHPEHAEVLARWRERRARA
jgi:transcriptional regulator with XRE-family HTH domain